MFRHARTLAFHRGRPRTSKWRTVGVNRVTPRQPDSRQQASGDPGAVHLDDIDKSLAEEVANELSRERRATSRFLGFMQRFQPAARPLRLMNGHALSGR